MPDYNCWKHLRCGYVRMNAMAIPNYNKSWLIVKKIISSVICAYTWFNVIRPDTLWNHHLSDFDNMHLSAATFPIDRRVCHQQIYRIFAIDRRLSAATPKNYITWSITFFVIKSKSNLLEWKCLLSPSNSGAIVIFMDMSVILDERAFT